MEYLSLSVHGLVDALFRQGDIDNRVFNSDTMQEGTRLHGVVQESLGFGYVSECPAEGDVVDEGFTIHLHGRADAVYDRGDRFMVVEIKSTVADLKTFFEENEEWHLSQAVCYAYLLAKERGKEKVDVQLYYLSQVSDDVFKKDYSFTFAELEAEVRSYVGFYLEGERQRRAKIAERNASLEHFPFPYETPRPGQEKMVAAIERSIERGVPVFVEAPTGIGKTISALYPATESFLNGTKKIFYLTAKQTGQESAVSQLDFMASRGAKVSYSKLDSKERMCRMPGASCNPDECPFARLYYTKLPMARAEAERYNGRLTPEAVNELADEFGICPFELELDLSEGSDVIIGDYNYLFDPMVFLDRYFGEDGFGEQDSYVALVDEAHNLVERARDIYGVEFSASELEDAYQDLIDSKGRKSRLKGVHDLLNSLKELSDDYAEGESFHDYSAIPSKLKDAIEYISENEKSIAASAMKRSKPVKKKKPIPPSYRSLTQKVRRASYLLESVDGMTFFSTRDEDGGMHFRFLLLDPSPYLKESVGQLKTAAFFSATLSPIDFYMTSILGEKVDALVLPSPFAREHFFLSVAPVSTLYRDRSRTYPFVAAYLSSFAKTKRGNIFVFFPSYGYLRSIVPFLDFGDLPVYVQEKGMGAKERKELLSHFQIGGEGVALLVLGGPFAEGIDLVDERLGAVAVVGVGFPQISHERDLIRASRLDDGDGYLFAYVYPGINKVMQAMGRLIRSENDVGAFLLIDRRYGSRDYRSLFEGSYTNPYFAKSPEDMSASLSAFLKRTKKV